MRLAVTLAATCLLSACAPPQTFYKGPPPEGNATLELKAENLTLYRIFPNGRECIGKESVPPESNIFKGGNAPLVIRANEEFALMLNTTESKYPAVRWCQLNVSFRPVPGGRYVARYRATGSECAATINRVTLLDGAEREARDPTFKLRETRTPFWPSGPFC